MPTLTSYGNDMDDPRGGMRLKAVTSSVLMTMSLFCALCG